MSQTRTPLSERKAAQARIEADLDRQAEQIDMDAQAARLRQLTAPVLLPETFESIDVLITNMRDAMERGLWQAAKARAEILVTFCASNIR